MGPHWQQGLLGALGRKQGAASEARARPGKVTRLGLLGTGASPSHQVHWWGGARGTLYPSGLVQESRSDPGGRTRTSRQRGRQCIMSDHV